MLTSITPLGERGRGNRYGVTMTAYVAGSVLGGATTGVVLGALGALTAARLPTAAVLGLGALACLLAAAADVTGRTRGGQRQVDEDWLTTYRGWVYGGGFGFQLGLGVVTVVTSAATYALLVLALLTGSPLGGLALGLAFGLVRSLPALGLRGVHTPERLREVARGLERRAAPAARATVAVLVVSAVVLAGGALASLGGTPGGGAA